MSSLYELTQYAAQLQNLLESGDIDEQTLNDTLEAMDIESKVENICKVIRNLEASAEAFKQEKDRLASKQKVAENGVQRLKDSLLSFMQVRNTPKVTAGLFTVSAGKTKAVEITDESKIPASFKVPQPDKVDKTALGKELKAGAEIEGAILVEREYVRIK